MIIVCKEVLESAPETYIYMLNTSLIQDSSLRLKFENPDHGVELNWDERNVLLGEERAFVDPPQIVERLVDVWIG